MAFKMTGWSAFTKSMAKNKGFDDDKGVKDTISKEEAKGINVEDISAVQEKDGDKFVHTLTDNETYMDAPFDPSVKRDTMRVNTSYNVGDLVDETDWEEGKATK